MSSQQQQMPSTLRHGHGHECTCPSSPYEWESVRKHTSTAARQARVGACERVGVSVRVCRQTIGPNTKGERCCCVAKSERCPARKECVQCEGSLGRGVRVRR